MTSRVLPAVVS
jgi:hypothetical protein